MSTFTLILIIGNMMATVPNFQTEENCKREGNKFKAIATRMYKEVPTFVCLQQDYVLEGEPDVQGPK